MKTAFYKRNLQIVLVCAGYFFLSRLVDAGCPFQTIFSFPCPTCGVTRALWSLVQMDFAASFRYHLFALPLAVSVWLALNADLLKKEKEILIFSGCVACLNFFYYAVRVLIFRWAI